MNRTLAFALLTAMILLPSAALADDGGFAAAVARGPLYASLAAFASGLLVSLTPCVYPMVAVTVSIFGARTAEHRWQGALLSAVFVAGIVLVFVPLGVAAGLTGGVFGAVLSSRYVVVALSALFLALAASMFGAFELDLPPALKNRLAGMGGGGVWGALILGMICGPIAAPCTGPFLTGILAWIAQTQSAGLGAGLMASFALGLGVPFFLVGAFAMQLPKSGRWMVSVKSLLGVVMVVVALYFLSSAFPALGSVARGGPAFIAGALAVAALGLAFGAVHKSFEGTPVGVKLSKAVGVVLTAGGTFLALMGFIKPEASLAWEYAQSGVGAPDSPLTEAAAQRARTEGRPLLVDFTAAWCVACKKMDKLTFTDADVRAEASRFLALKVDATDDEDPRVRATMKHLSVRGLPTLILFASSGQEARRFEDAVDPLTLTTALRSVQ